jgi:hypothetical protein
LDVTERRGFKFSPLEKVVSPLGAGTEPDGAFGTEDLPEDIPAGCDRPSEVKAFGKPFNGLFLILTLEERPVEFGAEVADFGVFEEDIP